MRNIKSVKVQIVMPAYNAARTIKDTFYEIPKKYRENIILVDDKSTDNTIEVAKKLGIKVFTHVQNLGYGGNQKTCYKEVLKENPDVVVMLHPDYQYDGSLTRELIQPIIDGRYDIMLGNRVHSRDQVISDGMPYYKYLGNRFLTIVENIALGQNLPEWHSGFRAFKKEVLENTPFQKFSNDFIFDQEILISAINLNFRIGYLNVPCRYFSDASSIELKRSIDYGFATVMLLIHYVLYKMGLVKDERFINR